MACETIGSVCANCGQRSGFYGHWANGQFSCEVPDEQIAAHVQAHDEAQAARTDVCTDCGKPVDQAQWTIATKTGYQTETRKFDRDSRGLGRYCLVPKREGLPYARSVSFEGSHNLHVCEALRDQEPIRPSGEWPEVDEDALWERRHWTNCPDLEALGYYR